MLANSEPVLNARRVETAPQPGRSDTLPVAQRSLEKAVNNGKSERGLLPFLGRAGGWLWLTALVALTVLPQGSTRVFTWPWVFYVQLGMIVPVIVAGWITLQCRGERRRGGIALIFMAASVGLSVGLSRNPHFSFEAALYLWSGLAAIWWLSQRLRDTTISDERFLVFARVAGLALVAPVVSSLAQWLAMLQPTFAAAESLRETVAAFGSARNPHPFGHPNYTGAFALIVFPWFGSLVFVERGRWRAAWMMAASLCLVLIFSSASRGAVLGMFALLLTAVALAFFTARISRRTGLWLLAVGVLLAGFLVLTNVRLRTLVTDFSALRYPSLGDVQRLGMLEGGIALGQQRPWVGHGPGMVPFVYPEVRAQGVGGVETSYQLHNAYVHQWATTGFVGLGAGLLLAAALIGGARSWLRQKSGYPRTFALGSAAALAGYAVMAATDYQLYVVGMVAALSLPAAFLLAAPGNRISTTAPGAGRVRLVSGLLLMGGGVAAVGCLIPHWQARELHWSAWANTSETDSASLAVKLREATEVAPWNTHYRNQLGLLFAREAQRSNQAAHRQLARTELLASVQSDPAQEPIHANLAWLWLPDDPAKGTAAFRQALSLIPDRDTLHYGLALSRLAVGDEAGAVHALAMECLVNPPFIASPLWTEPPFVILKDPVRTRVGELVQAALSHPALPQWRQRDLIYFRAVLRWWNGGPVPAGEELFGADALQRAFFRAAASDLAADVSLLEPWRELAAIAERDSNSLPQGGDRGQAARAGALARLRAGGASIPDLIRSAAPGKVGVTQYLLERRHYPLMHRNLDAPGYLDLAPHTVDAFSQRYLEPLLPARGLIPGPVLVDLEGSVEAAARGTARR